MDNMVTHDKVRVNKSLDIIKNYYQSFNNKTYDGMLNLLHDSIIHDINQGEQQIGKNQFNIFLQNMDNYYNETLTSFQYMSNHDGSRIAVEFICDGVYKKTCEGLPPAKGQKYHLNVVCIFEIKDSLISRISNYYNLEEWLAQVKL